MFSVGQELKRERELRGIRLGQIAEETKIGVRFLEAIDAGRVHVIPGQFYRRAYIQAYARYLGLDEERFVAAYEFVAAGDAKPQLPSSTTSGTFRWPKLPLAAAMKWAALAIAGVGLSGAAAAVWRRAPEANPTPSQLEAFQSATGRVGLGSRSADPVRLPFVRDELEEEEPSPTSLRLTLKIDEPCWLEIRADGEPVAEGIMLRGFEKEFEAAEICLSLGNAGGVSYWIDGRAGNSLGQLGQVRKNVCITPENVDDFVS